MFPTHVNEGMIGVQVCVNIVRSFFFSILFFWIPHLAVFFLSFYDL